MKRALNEKTKANHSAPPRAYRFRALRSGENRRRNGHGRPQTIHDRTQRMPGPGLASARDRKELLLRGQEKLEAAAQSS
ncbi:MAG: hypothetical protein ACREYE_24805, partial [Gammaproteobacteria bacterium]